MSITAPQQSPQVPRRVPVSSTQLPVLNRHPELTRWVKSVVSGANPELVLHARMDGKLRGEVITVDAFHAAFSSVLSSETTTPQEAGVVS